MSYENNLWWNDYKFERLGDLYPKATLFGSNPTWHDAVQGTAGNCYLVAATGALAEYPDLVKSIFLNDKNDAGIYALRFYIRGKPWVVTVDDFVYTFDFLGTRRPLFGQEGKQNAIWAMIIEKAWSKVKGSYSHIDGGFTQNGLRAVTGAPVFSYFSKDI